MEEQTMTAMIFGGTGTLGHALAAKLDDAVIVSRDELKQQQMKIKFPGCIYEIADVRDRERVFHLIKAYKPSKVFHLAALKHVDKMESQPDECLKTNFLGSVNVADACKDYGIKDLYFTSTDKACMPINVYGCSKFLAERYIIKNNPKAKVFRWGNILGSRGSVLGAFVKSLLSNRTVSITDVEMTRFWLKIDEVADFMLSADPQKYGNIHIPPMRSARVIELAQATAGILSMKEDPDIMNYQLKIIGKRPGEKIHECMYASDEFCLTSENAQKFSYVDLIEYIEPIVEKLL
jgi:UDP-N-acetylglucosamine 4,6-dehydratase